jgi:hypothetical protein
VRRGLFWGVLILAVLIGLLLAWLDTRLNWDDTAVMVGLIFLVTAFLGAFAPGRAWVWALAVGGWIPLVETLRSSNFGALVALVVAFAGAYAGAFVGRGLLGRR